MLLDSVHCLCYFILLFFFLFSRIEVGLLIRYFRFFFFLVYFSYSTFSLIFYSSPFLGFAGILTVQLTGRQLLINFTDSITYKTSVGDTRTLNMVSDPKYAPFLLTAFICLHLVWDLCHYSLFHFSEWFWFYWFS
jgi:hypothetical protein